MKNKSLEIKQGTLILTEKPFVYVLKSKYRTERCDFCLANGKVHQCRGCQYTYYCNVDCQKSSWKQHKNECQSLKNIMPRIVPDAARILSKIIWKLKNGGDLEKGYYTEKSYRKFRDLMSHYPELKNDTKRMEHIESLQMVLKELIIDTVLPNPTELLGIYGRLITNGFNILDDEMNSIGTGIYLGVSVTDHSCIPNAVATFNKTTLYVRTVRDLPNLDWSQIFISYIDLLNTTEDRRNDLKENYYFLCVCSKCVDPIEPVEMSSAACPNQRCNEFININSMSKCPKCDRGITNAFKQEYYDVMEFTKIHLENMKDVAYLDVSNICLNKQRNVLHKLNLWHVKTLDAAFESAISLGKWEEALIFGRKLIPGFKKYYGDFNPLLGLLYMKLGKIELYDNQIKEAKHNLILSENIIKITHGNDSNLYKNELLPLLIEATTLSNH